MESDLIGWQILLQVILILLNAVFACAEIAVISMNDSKLAKLVEEGDKRAVRLSRLTNQPARFLATIQVAITLSGFLGSAFAADNFSDKLVYWLMSLGVAVPEKTLDTISVILITLILSYFTLVFGELVPKRIAMRKAEALALGMSALITFISKLFAPIVWTLTASTNGILRLIRIDPNADDNTVTEEEIRMMVDVGSEKGVIDPDEKELIENVFEFDDLTAQEIATHRMDVSVIWFNEEPEQWDAIIRESRHNMFPVCQDSVDNVVGVLSAREYFRLRERTREQVLAIVRPAYFVPSSVKANVLFRNMKRTHNRFAVVLDNYGGMQGVITLSDLVEQLVGALEEDAQETRGERGVHSIGENIWRIHGNVTMQELEEVLPSRVPTDHYDTLGELVFSNLGAIPADGSSFELDLFGLHIKVEEIKDHKLQLAEVSLAPLSS